MGVFDRLGKLTAALKPQGDLVYFPGCTTQKFLPHIAENYKTILTDLGLPVRTVEPFCCGRPLQEQGYPEDFAKHVAKTKAKLAQQGVTRVVTNCAACIPTLREAYGLEVMHTTELLAQQRRKLPQLNSGEVTFQDNCIAARKLNLVQEPRDILVHTGYTVKEFTECKKGVRCCGGSCGLPNNAASVATKLAQRRLRDAPAQTIVTDDPHCYIQLKKNGQQKDVLELSETIVEI